jgi:hypothetical protein
VCTHQQAYFDTNSEAPAMHVVVDISAHGFGHVAQSSAVINALHHHATNKGGDFHLTVRSCADEATLRERICRPFDLIPYRQDQGMIMHDAMRVDTEATMDWYRDFHANYNRKKSHAATDLERLRPDVLFSDVPYLGLDAANLAGVPAVAMCSLNWADIFLSYCSGYKGSAKIHDEIVEAYNTANTFLQPASCSLVVTKTGYGTQTESVLNLVPSICIERLDWPEHKYLRRWHEEHGEVEFIDLMDMGSSKQFESMVTDLLTKPWSKDSIQATGDQEAADILGQLLW